MYVMIGRTPIDNHEIVQLRYALEDREAVLKKAINAAENARLPTRDGSTDLETCKRLAALLDPTSHADEESRRTQYDAFEQRESQPVDEAIEEAEKEAARQRQREIDRALRMILFGFTELADMDQEELADFRALDERALAVDVTQYFDDQAYVENDPRDRLDGVYRHEREDGTVAWCFVSTEGGVLRFWYDVQLFTDDTQRIAFDEKNTPATYVGEALLARIRRAFQAEPEVQTEEQPAEDAPDPVARWAHDTRPHPTIEDGTGVVAQALHTAIFERGPLEAAPQHLFARREIGMTDEEIADALLDAFGARAPEDHLERYGWSEPVERTDGHMDYVAVEVHMPDGKPTTLTVGKGKGKQKVELPELVKIARGMLGLPEAEEQPLEVVPAEEPEPAGV